MHYDVGVATLLSLDDESTMLEGGSLCATHGSLPHDDRRHIGPL
jgi:hypothetical protein